MLSQIGLILALVASHADVHLKGTLAVVNQQDSTVSLIDLGSGKTVHTVTTGIGPHEAAFSPDGTQLAISNYGAKGHFPGDSLSIVSIPGGKLTKTISLGELKAPHGIQWLSNDHLVCTSEVTNHLTVVDVGKGTVERTLATEQKGSHLFALSSDNTRIYSANVFEGTVTAMDFSTGEKLAVVPVGKSSEGIGISPDGRFVFTGNRDSQSVSVIDTAKLATVKELPLEGLPYRVLCEPTGHYAYISNPVKSEIAVLAIDTLSISRRVSLLTSGKAFGLQEPSPTGMALSPAGEILFTSLVDAKAAVAVDLKEGKIIARYDVGNSPDGVAFSPIEMKG